MSLIWRRGLPLLFPLEMAFEVVSSLVCGLVVMKKLAATLFLVAKALLEDVDVDRWALAN